MATNPWMKLYVSDLLGDTMRLTAEQFGAYMLLLCAMWQDGGSLPDDDATLARIARIPPQRWPAVRSTLAKYLSVIDGQITQKRLQKELEKALDISEKRSEAGRKGVEAKSLKTGDAGEASGESKPPRKRSSKTPSTRVRSRNQNPDKALAGLTHADAREPAQPGPDELTLAANRIFAMTPPAAQERTTVEKIGYALRDVLDDVDMPADLDDVEVGMANYYADPDSLKEGGKFAAAPHRYIEDGRWRPWVKKRRSSRDKPNLDPAPVDAPTVEFGGRTWDVPPGCTSDHVGDLKNPGIKRQDSWMKDWKRTDGAAWRRGECGPKPGEEGCRVWPEVQRMFGAIPFGDEL